MNSKIIFGFLNDLQKNNNRDWFKANEIRYQLAKNEFEDFIEEVIPGLKKIDNDIDAINAKECIFRIYKDVRFSKDKNPYKTNFGAYISKGGRKSKFAGYYIHLEPGKSFIGGGIYMPEAAELKAIRDEIFNNTGAFKKILNNQSFKKYFKEIYGEKLITAPKGFPKDFADIDLLKNKHYAVTHSVKDSFWNSDSLITEILKIFKAQLPFNRFLNNAVK